MFVLILRILFLAKKLTERAKVMFDYEPENPDELKLTEGDIVVVTNQNIPDTEGWWEGELNGIAGVFPSNFVELLPVGAEEVLSKVLGFFFLSTLFYCALRLNCASILHQNLGKVQTKDLKMNTCSQQYPATLLQCWLAPWKQRENCSWFKSH